MEKESKMQSKERSVKFIKWKMDNLIAQTDEFNLKWQERDLKKAAVIDAMGAKIVGLERELASSKKREKKLIKRLSGSQEENEKLKQRIDNVNRSLYERTKKYFKFQKDHESALHQCSAVIADIERQRDSVVTHMQREMDLCMKRAIETHKAYVDMKKQVQQYERQVFNLMKQLAHLEREKTMTVEDLTKKLAERDKVIDNAQQQRINDKAIAGVKIKDLETHISEHAQTIAEMVTEKLEKDKILNETSKRCAALSGKVEEIDVVKQGIKAVAVEMASEKDINYVLRSSLGAVKRKMERLREEREKEKEILKETEEILTKIRRDNDALMAENRLLTSNVDISEQVVRRKTDEAMLLMTRLRRIHGDIEELARVIDDPKQLRLGVQYMKQRYPYSYEQVTLNEETKESYELGMLIMQKNLEHSERLLVKANEDVRRLKTALSNLQNHMHKLRIHYNKILNEQTDEIAQLESQLADGKFHARVEQ